MYTRVRTESADGIVEFSRLNGTGAVAVKLLECRLWSRAWAKETGMEGQHQKHTHTHTDTSTQTHRYTQTHWHKSACAHLPAFNGTPELTELIEAHGAAVVCVQHADHDPACLKAEGVTGTWVGTHARLRQALAQLLRRDLIQQKEEEHAHSKNLALCMHAHKEKKTD